MAKNKTKITDREQEVINLFKDFKKKYGYYPSFRQAGLLMGVSREVVYKLIKNAEDKGYKGLDDRHKLYWHSNKADPTQG